jgi:hypothetical protein
MKSCAKPREEEQTNIIAKPGLRLSEAVPHFPGVISAPWADMGNTNVSVCGSNITRQFGNTTAFSAPAATHGRAFGIMPIPNEDEEQQCGHEVPCLGCDLSKQLAPVQNSCGDDWGQRGYFLDVV